MRQRNRFIQSKCDRCGKTTPAKQNGIGDLFTLPHEYAEPLSDSGDFCAACCERYDEANWLAWFKGHRTETTADAALVAEMSALRAELEAAKAREQILLAAAEQAWRALLERTPHSVPGGEEACEALHAAIVKVIANKARGEPQ